LRPAAAFRDRRRRWPHRVGFAGLAGGEDGLAPAGKVGGRRDRASRRAGRRARRPSARKAMLAAVGIEAAASR
jgi:hypothetical protein